MRSAELASRANSYIGAWHAAALAKAGRTTEARHVLARFFDDVRAEWYGEPDPSDAAITRWLLESFPIRESSALSSLREGLTMASTAVLEV